MALMLWVLTANAVPPKGIIELRPEPAPPLRLADGDGEITDLAALRGRWVIVHFWASWCGPCRREMPTLHELSQHPVGQRFAFVLVNTAETDDEIFSFLSVVAPELKTLRDSDGKATDRWAPRGLPSTFIVDPAGNVRFVALGGRVWNSPEFLAFLDSLAAP